MDWLQRLGATNYLGKEKPKSQTHRGEELSLLPSAIRLRTGSRPRGGVEQHTPKGVVTCKGGRDRVLLLTEILNTEETETIDTKCFATEELSFSLSYCAAGVWWPSQYYIKYSNSFLVFRKGWNNQTPVWYVQHKNLDKTLLSHSNNFIHLKLGFLEYSLMKYSSLRQIWWEMLQSGLSKR